MDMEIYMDERDLFNAALDGMDMEIYMDERDLFNAALDGMEATLLAIACTGVQIDPQAVQTALDAITNHFT